MIISQAKIDAMGESELVNEIQDTKVRYLASSGSDKDDEQINSINLKIALDLLRFPPPKISPPLTQEEKDDLDILKTSTVTLKHVNIDHGRTDLNATDIYFSFKKSSDNGGTIVTSVAENVRENTSLKLYCSGATATTDKTTSAVGLCDIYVEEHDGANTKSNITSDGNVFSVRSRVGDRDVARLLVDEDGDLYSVTSAQTFDKLDDVALIEVYDQTVSLKQTIRDDFSAWAGEKYAEKKLIDCGILGGTVKSGGMTCVTQLQRLQNGAIRQLVRRLNLVESKLNRPKIKDRVNSMVQGSINKTKAVFKGMATKLSRREE